MTTCIPPFLRYPGSKRRMLNFLCNYLPKKKDIQGRFVEPFVGGGAIYFYLRPHRALLADINDELITIYRGIKFHPQSVWRFYRNFPAGKRAYKNIREMEHEALPLSKKAARSLYLNRTCFKGMWRHNQAGKFNVGYGGEGRRWALSRQDLQAISCALRPAALKASDFEEIVMDTTSYDFLFLDPPYRPGAREQTNEHYAGRQFSFSDHQRLSAALKWADRQGIPWAMTTSSHPDIKRLFKSFRIVPLPRGTGPKPGILISDSGEVLIANR